MPYKQPPALPPINLPAPSASLVAFAIAGLFALIAIFTSFYTVPTDSEGVTLRFGKYNGTTEPGLHFKLPLGIDSVELVQTRRQLKLEFGFYTPGYTNPEQVGREDLDEQKAMVTGDLNAALVEWVVQYRIEDPRQFLFDVSNPGQTLRDISEAAMREVIGDRTVDEVITIGRQEIEVNALTKMQALAQHYQLGIRVDQVQLKNVNPPQQVVSSFNEVNKAQQDRENMINIASGEYNKVIPKARGEADQQIRSAEGYQFKRVNEAEGDVSAFRAMLEQYTKSPEITRTRIYFETMAEVVPQMGSKIIVDESLKQMLPLLQLKPEDGRR
ncbi:MAG TPA: FtsH protease activity modulator HflK [Chthoniobacteraceae bacterium]|nr:FtsH protease activity modulator HflK [Chthoniobacteraceae bacterium]